MTGYWPKSVHPPTHDQCGGEIVICVNFGLEEFEMSCSKCGREWKESWDEKQTKNLWKYNSKYVPGKPTRHYTDDRSEGKLCKCGKPTYGDYETCMKHWV